MTVADLVSTPQLIEGDSLTSEEFLRRWEEMPGLKRAELIDGIVYMPSPVSVEHSDYQGLLHFWLCGYAAATRGCRAHMEATWIMGDRQTTQPDVVLRILPEYGGQSGLSGPYASGAPELIVEVAASSLSRDFGAKKRLYEKAGVREYLIASPRDRRLHAFSWTPSGYTPISAGPTFRSVAFPGLHLYLPTLWDLDFPGITAGLRESMAGEEYEAFASGLCLRHGRA